MYDVIIAGAGPVGLFLASELRLANLSVLILERETEPHTLLKGQPFGMRGLWGPSVEAFYRRGLLDQISAEPNKGGPGRPQAASTGKQTGPAGHFAGIQFLYDNIDQTRWTYRLPGPGSGQTGATMNHIETVLGAHALAAGVEIQRGRGVERFETFADHVIVNDDLQARWLVGCDGGRSTVRKLAGFEFIGTEPEFTGYSLFVELADPTAIPMGRHWTAHGMYTQWQPGAIGLADFDGGTMHRTQITVEHAQAVLRRVTGLDVVVTAVKQGSTWTDRSMQASTYRKGRVLLAGDAAHVHSPLGGQGLNLGLGDAMNLGWKLAAEIRGTAPGGLLDSYTVERHPIGARVLEWTRAQVALMKPSAQALQAVVRDLINTHDGATYFAERVWGVNLQYEPGAHPLVGRSCPDFELLDGTRVNPLLKDGVGLLLDFDRALPDLSGVRRIASDVKDRLGVTAVLVRPDGFVAWASDGTRDDLHEAAARYFKA
ncbi:MAG: FAD-dependent monooxygenase [Kofleriaceae bacterium]